MFSLFPDVSTVTPKIFYKISTKLFTQFWGNLHSIYVSFEEISKKCEENFKTEDWRKFFQYFGNNLRKQLVRIRKISRKLQNTQFLENFGRIFNKFSE